HCRSIYSYMTHNDAITRIYLNRERQNDQGAEATRKFLRPRLPQFPGVNYKLDDRNDGGNGGPSRIAVRVFGGQGPRLDQLTKEVGRRMALVPGIADVKAGGDKGSEELEVVVDRDRAAAYGLGTSQVANAVATFFRGRPLSRFRGPDGEVQVVARLAEE